MGLPVLRQQVDKWPPLPMKKPLLSQLSHVSVVVDLLMLLLILSCCLILPYNMMLIQG